MKVRAICRFLICVLALVLGIGVPAWGQTARWSAAMGQSGLRRLYSTGGDLGELLNRQVSYRVANRTGEARSRENTYVGQWDSLVSLRDAQKPPLFLRGLTRIAKRVERGKVDAMNDRFDLGVLYAPNIRSYIGVGLAYEHIDADLTFTNGKTIANGLGPRIDAGRVFAHNLALGVRVEQMHFEGDTHVEVTTPRGPVGVDRSVEYRRRFLQAELTARYGRAQLAFLPARMQLGWMGSTQYLETRYEPQIDSRGQVASEPFGNKEHLGIVRAGGYLGGNLGRKNNWNANIELMFDHEVSTNLNHPIDDKTTAYVRGGLAYILKPGKRIQFDYQGFRSMNGHRSRNNLSLIAVMDF